MSHPYFFVDKNCITPDSVFITGEDFNHLVKVLRARVGDIVEISDNESKRYNTTLAEIKKDEAVLQINHTTKITGRAHRISLFLCVLKKEAMELAIQKAAEIGADRIIPVLSARTVVDIGGKKSGAKISRWQQIALSASKQCKRDFICEITEPVNTGSIDVFGFNVFFLPIEDPYLDDKGAPEPGPKGTLQALSGIIKGLKDNSSVGGIDGTEDKSIAAALEDFNIAQGPKKKSITKGLNKNENSVCFTGGPNLPLEIACIIGPEGGFEKKEVADLVKKGAISINFGTNILRSETASIYFLSILDYLLK